jgi:hypothetical protein
MRRIIPSIVALSCVVLLVGCASSRSHITHQPANAASGADITGLRDAVAIAASAILEQSPYPASDYVLTAARQMTIKGKYIWRVTFKPSQLLPEDPSKEAIGAGGEIFVNVDLKTKKAEIRGGE